MRQYLIDADVLLYRAAHLSEREIQWDDDLHTIHASFEEACSRFDTLVRQLKLTLPLYKIAEDQIVLCVSDWKNFRHQIAPNYKAGRAKGRKPLCFKRLKEWVLAEQDSHSDACVCLPLLEADDTMGILATETSTAGKVIVTIDKDLKTIPGYHYNFDKPGQGLIEVTPAEADEFWLTQCLAGDPTDGIPGLPKIGMIRAGRMLDSEGCSWATVLNAYAKNDNVHGDLTALQNSWLVRILTADLWSPGTGPLFEVYGMGVQYTLGQAAEMLKPINEVEFAA